MSSLTDEKAYATEARLNKLMGRVGLVDSGGNPQVVSGAGWTGNISGSKLAAVSSISGLATTVLTSVGFTTVPGGDIEAGTSYDIHASGFFSTGAVAPSGITFGVYWDSIGGTQLVSVPLTAADMGGGITGASWTADAEVDWMSATQAEAALRVGWHTATGVDNGITRFEVGFTFGLTTTVAKNLSLGVQWGTAPAGTSLNCDVCRLGRVA